MMALGFVSMGMICLKQMTSVTKFLPLQQEFRRAMISWNRLGVKKFFRLTRITNFQTGFEWVDLIQFFWISSIKAVIMVWLSRISSRCSMFLFSLWPSKTKTMTQSSLLDKLILTFLEMNGNKLLKIQLTSRNFSFSNRFQYTQI
jgi:hypothetical protein